MSAIRRAAFGAAAMASALALGPAAAQAQGCWSNAEDPSDRPSPLDSATAMMGDDLVKVCYGAPSAKGRHIVGGEMHPFGEPWRTGANEATSLHLPFDATVAGAELAAGSYSLHTVPGADSWSFHFSDDVERWGVPIDASADAGSGTASSFENDHTETLTLSFENVSADAATLVLRWEGYRVEAPVERRN